MQPISSPTRMAQSGAGHGAHRWQGVDRLRRAAAAAGGRCQGISLAERLVTSTTSVPALRQHSSRRSGALVWATRTSVAASCPGDRLRMEKLSSLVTSGRLDLHPEVTHSTTRLGSRSSPCVISHPTSSEASCYRLVANQLGSVI